MEKRQMLMFLILLKCRLTEYFWWKPTAAYTATQLYRDRVIVHVRRTTRAGSFLAFQNPDISWKKEERKEDKYRIWNLHAH